MPEISLQPKQSAVYELVYNGSASWLGMPGGRGGAKSGGMQRIMIDRRGMLPGTIGVIVMRNYEQVQKYHVDVILRDYPELTKWYSKPDSRIVLPMGRDRAPSEIQFSWAPALKDVIRRFRSGSFYDIMVDQAEQFTEPELREMKQACRWKGAPQGACKFILAFNMGGAGIDFLRKKFHLKELNVNERREDFEYVHFFPWDNVEWSRAALEEDGLTAEDYYSWDEEARRTYCATRSDYGRNLISQDAPLVKRDWFGSWDSLEGAFFGRVFDRDSTVLAPEQINALIKAWTPRWISQDWGRGHYCSTHWHAAQQISPAEAKKILGWEIAKPIRAIITYREYIAGGEAAPDEGGKRELAEQDVARRIVKETPVDERKYVSHFYLSPDAFAKKSAANTIAEEESAILMANGLPRAFPADNDREGGWGLMYNLLLETKRRGLYGEDVWLISSECPELDNAIPLLMRDPKNLDDILKTDTSQAKIEQDVGDDVRYGMKSHLSPGVKPKEVERAETLAKTLEATQDMTAVHMANLRFEQDNKAKFGPFVRPTRWRRK